MSAISTRDTDQESQRDCPVVVSVEELAFELMNLVSFMLWSEAFPCRFCGPLRILCGQRLGTAEGQGGQSLPKLDWIYLLALLPPPKEPWMCESL